MPLPRALGAVSIEAITCYLAASVLWIFPGTTVTEGPRFATATCLLILVLGSLLSMLLSRAGTRTSQFRWYLVSIRAVILAIAVVSWMVFNIYYLGWLATFGALTMGVAGVWQLLTDLLEASTDKSDSRAAHFSGQRRARLATSSAVVVAIGVAALVTVAPVHEWRLEILSPLVVVASTSLLLAFLVVRLSRTPGRDVTMAQAPHHEA